MNRIPERGARIPEFASLKEEAEFWDTPSTTEFEDEWEPVEVEVARPLKHALMVSMVRETFFASLISPKSAINVRRN
ncbi:MAG: hypothetical protein ACRDJH_21015 [Thermomicrobiales bacterium]